ncbi:MAG TPA: TonB family protein [Chitinophagaceae bacterium]|nr:TonB family protein [Chitinophagaceae bacterium]
MKTFRWLLLIGILSFQAKGQTVTKIEQPVKGLVKIKYGVLKKNRHVKDGAYQYFFADHLLTEGTYHQGERTGIWKFYNLDTTVAFMGTYLEGVKVGKWLYTCGGHLFSQIDYDAYGRVMERYTLFPDGDTALTLERRLLDGDSFRIRKTYYPSRHPRESAYFANDTLRDTAWYPNGQVKRISYQAPGSGDKVVLLRDASGQPLPLDSLHIRKSYHTRKYPTDTIMPSFPGGQAVLRSFLSKMIRYPAGAATGVGGTVKLSFIIDRDGYVRSVKVLHHLGASFDDEAVTVIKLMPRWSPAMVMGMPTKIKYFLPVRFHR